MSLVLIANNDCHRKMLERAFSLLEQDIFSYSTIDDMKGNETPEIVVCLLEGQNLVKLQQLATKIPVFAVLEPRNNVSEEDKAVFRAVFHAPLRLGRIMEAVRVYKRQSVQKQQLTEVKIGKYILDPKNSSLTIENKIRAVRLTEKEQDILLYLYHNKDKSIDRQTLLDHVWGYVDGVETHTLETHIYRLRQKIEEDPSNPDFLMTNDDGYYLRF